MLALLSFDIPEGIPIGFKGVVIKENENDFFYW